MTGMNTTRGRAFDPSVAQAQREEERAVAVELERQAREQARQARKEELRAYGRLLDEQARKERRRKRKEERARQQREIEQCYRERGV